MKWVDLSQDENGQPKFVFYSSTASHHSLQLCFGDLSKHNLWKIIKFLVDALFEIEQEEKSA